MDLPRLFALQERLDRRILTEHGLAGRDLTDCKILAFQVELGELANETRVFKYWSRRPPSPREVIREEFADCLHFLLTLGIDHGFTDLALPPLPAEPQGPEGESTLVRHFQGVFDQAARFARSRSREDYVALFQALLALGRCLGFSDHEMEGAYERKNRTNHQRQLDGY